MLIGKPRQITKIDAFIKKQKWRWIGHMIRENKSKWTKTIGLPMGLRSNGCRKKEGRENAGHTT